MEETNEIMVNDEALAPDFEEEAEKEKSALPIIAGIGAVGVLVGVLAHKHLISPLGAKFKAWRKSKKAVKEDGEVVEAEIVDSDESK